MHIFYIPGIQSGQSELSPEESHHAVRVLRLGNGDLIQIIDGAGGFYTARVENPSPKACSYTITSATSNFGKRDYHLHMAIAPTKNIDRFEWFLEKATEIGVDEISPILCERSERKNVNHDRLSKIIVAAAKQSIKAYMPLLHELTPLKRILELSNAPLKHIAHCQEGEKTNIKDISVKKSSLLILIGPEGDFTPPEIEWANSEHIQGLSLGDSRLRTETAGMVACAAVNLLSQLDG